MSTTTTTKHCPGLPKYGLEPHEAAVTEFSANKQLEGGLNRLCRVCAKRSQQEYLARKKAKTDSPQPERASERAMREADQVMPPRNYRVKANGTLEPEPELNGESPEATKRRAQLEKKLAHATPEESEKLRAAAAQEAAAGRRLRDREYRRQKRAAEKAAKAGAR